jgi:hypothetical protein
MTEITEASVKMLYGWEKINRVKAADQVKAFDHIGREFVTQIQAAEPTFRFCREPVFTGANSNGREIYA